MKYFAGKTTLLLLTLTFFVLNSCTKEEDPTAPSLTFKEGPASNDLFYIGTDTVLTVEQPFMLGIKAKTTNDKNLSSVKIERHLEVVGIKTILKKDLSSPTFELDTMLKASDQVGTEDFFCTVADKNNMEMTIHFSIVTEEADPMITRYNAVKLGSTTSPAGNLFSLSTGGTFRTEAATDSTELQPLADWVYFHGLNFGHTLASPSSTIAGEIYSNTIAGWDTENKNSTRFKKTPSITESQFLVIANKQDLVAAIDNQEINWDMTEEFFSENNSTPGGFGSHDIIAFKNHNGRIGLIHVNSVHEGATNGESYINFDVVIEDLPQ